MSLSPAQIFLWSLKDNELTGMAFIDTQLYIHQMISVKSFILAADLMKSISLLRYQEESKTLSLVSRVSRRDTEPATGPPILPGDTKLPMGPPKSFGDNKLALGPPNLPLGHQSFHGATKSSPGPPKSPWVHQTPMGLPN